MCTPIITPGSAAVSLTLCVAEAVAYSELAGVEAQLRRVAHAYRTTASNLCAALDARSNSPTDNDRDRAHGMLAASSECEHIALLLEVMASRTADLADFHLAGNASDF